MPAVLGELHIGFVVQSIADTRAAMRAGASVGAGSCHEARPGDDGQGTGPGSSGLTLTVLSDFQESGVPLQVIPACPIYPPHKQPTPQSLLKACVKWLHFTCSKVASLRRTFLLQASVVLHETYTLARMCDCFTGVRGGFCAPLFCQCR